MWEITLFRNCYGSKNLHMLSKKFCILPHSLDTQAFVILNVLQSIPLTIFATFILGETTIRNSNSNPQDLSSTGLGGPGVDPPSSSSSSSSNGGAQQRKLPGWMYRNGALDLWEEGEGEAAGAARGEEQVDPEEYEYDDDEDDDEDIVKRKPILVEPTSPPPLR